jgi:class 3 adenylate cyclase
MVSERIQRRIDALLDEADASVSASDWTAVAEKARAVLAIDEGNEDAAAFLKMAEANGVIQSPLPQRGRVGEGERDTTTTPDAIPVGGLLFASGRYRATRLLGEGGRKRVFLAHDTRLDREVAFAQVRTDGLDAQGRQRVLQEAQGMARLGAHPNLVTIHDLGEESGNPYIVFEYMSGGDVATLLNPLPGPPPLGEGERSVRLPLARTLAIAMDVCRGLAFIHERGVVHRDLKPQNVFLGSDGKARIGDFGLALALERSRITQYGMMLGTVAYMPPEQALGGDVTGRSDLYSLGAMLYEMVTGRTPFVGDDPTAVISQHVNTPPVAPSWLTEHCPPPLEDLILRLLAKNPADRPENALAVLTDLERIDPEQKSATYSESNALDRLARGVFVGRDKELERLRKAFDEAFAGRGGLVMVVGEPGIGKTRTTQELETYARMRGAQVLWGRAHESSGAPPYWPWVQAGRMWGAANDVTALQDMMRSTNGELTRLFPELRNIAGFVEPETVNDPESAQFRLFDAYTTFVRGMTLAPTLSQRERGNEVADGQTRDPGSANLRIGPNAASAPLSREVGRGVGGGPRPHRVGRPPLGGQAIAAPAPAPFARAWADACARRGHLPGHRAEPHAPPERSAGDVEPRGRVPARRPARADAGRGGRLHPRRRQRRPEARDRAAYLRRDRGEPLLPQRGRQPPDAGGDADEGIGERHRRARRCARGAGSPPGPRISEETNELLQVAAVVGREFTYDTLTLLGDRDDDELLRRIEEALGARVIEEMEAAGRYRFTHALMQETLLDELSTTRRVRLHGQVGEALERRWGDRAEQNASRLAHHFVESATLTARHAEKALRYAKLAAEAAEKQSAWAEAARWYEAALSVITAAADGGTLVEAELLAALGRCDANDDRIREAFRELMRAIGLFRQLGAPLQAASTALVSLVIPMPAERLSAVRAQALGDVGDADPHLRAQLLTRYRLPHDEDYDRDFAEAERLAGGRDWSDVKSRLVWRQYIELQTAGRFDEAAEAGREAHELALRAGDTRWAAATLDFQEQVASNQGDLGAVQGGAQESIGFAERYRLTTIVRQQNTRLAALHLARWDIEDYARSLEAGNAVWGYLLSGWKARVEGRPAEALTIVPTPDNSVIPAFWAGYWAERACSLAMLGETQESEREFEKFWGLFLATPGAPAPMVAAVTIAADAAVLLGRHDIAPRLFSFPLALQRFSLVPTQSLDRVRGDLALFMDRTDDAAEQFRAGLELCTRERLPVEVGRCHLGLAEVTRRRGDIAAALTHLERASDALRPTGAKLYLDQVIAKKVELQGLSSRDMGSSIHRLQAAVVTEQPDLRSAAAPDGTVTLMFSDIENSTALNEGMGDARWMEVLRHHDDLIRRHVQEHGGFVVKTMGDGFMVAFASASSALRCAVNIQAALGSPHPGPPPLGEGERSVGGAPSTQHPAPSTPPVRVRIGLHTGEAVRQGDDFYGRHVNIAARVAASALGGEIAVSALLREIVGSSGKFAFDEGHEVELKGIALPQRVYRVVSAPVE